MGTVKYIDKVCECCGSDFKAKRHWQKYCKPECRDAVTEIYNELLAEVRIPTKVAAIKLAKLRIDK